MKKLGGLVVVGCLVGALVGGPASAATKGRELTAREAAKVCKTLFAKQQCDESAAEWRRALASQDRVSVERFVDAAVADAGAHKRATPEEECRIVFSEFVCVWVDFAMHPVRNPGVWIDFARNVVVGVLDTAYAAVRCVLAPACTPLPPIPPIVP